MDWSTWNWHLQDSCGENCEPCSLKLESVINNAFRVSGGIGLFFSFTEVNFISLCILKFYLIITVTKTGRISTFEKKIIATNKSSFFNLNYVLILLYCKLLSSQISCYKANYYTPIFFNLVGVTILLIND